MTCPRCGNKNPQKIGKYSLCLDCGWNNLPKLNEYGEKIIMTNANETVETWNSNEASWVFNNIHQGKGWPNLDIQGILNEIEENLE